MTEHLRPRWFTEFDAGHSAAYVERFRRAAAAGEDLSGEARLVDAMVPRSARVLDAGCGGGRVGAALHDRGHIVVGVDIDAELIAAARADHSGPRWEVADLAHMSLDEAPFDAAVLAGNVLVFVTPGSEAAVLTRVAAHVQPDGFVVVGFATDRDYGIEEFDRDCEKLALPLEHRFATWDLRPWYAEAPWAVSVLRMPS